MEQSNISNIIKSLRINRGLTQEQLAESTQLNLRTIQRIENNETTPRGDTLKRIADSLKIPESEIIGLDMSKDRNVLILMTLSQLTFLLFPLLGILIPMVIWLIRKDKDPFVDREGKVILNFQLFWVFLFLVLFLLFLFSNFFHTVSLFFSPSILIIYLIVGFMILFHSIRIWKGKRSFYFPYLKILT